MSKPVERRPLTADEALCLQQMRGHVGMPSASFDKRFFGRIAGAVEISDKESAQLWRLFIRYRRQMSFPAKARLLKVAETLAAPDFRKLQVAAREQARIDGIRTNYEKAMKEARPCK